MRERIVIALQASFSDRGRCAATSSRHLSRSCNLAAHSVYSALRNLLLRNAAAARQGNEINTARRLLKIGFAPVDLLYSESLTKVTKVTSRRNQVRFSFGFRSVSVRQRRDAPKQPRARPHCLHVGVPRSREPRAKQKKNKVIRNTACVSEAKSARATTTRTPARNTRASLAPTAFPCTSGAKSHTSFVGAEISLFYSRSWMRKAEKRRKKTDPPPSPNTVHITCGHVLQLFSASSFAANPCSSVCEKGVL
jgi:hypothetical protein